MICSICNSNSTYFIFEITSYETQFKVRKCSDCLSLFQWPVLPQDDLYDEGYYEGDSNYNYRDERNQYEFDKIVHEARLKNIRKYVKSGSFLDIGCSFGGLCLSASEHYKSFGLDVSKFAIDKGKLWLNKVSKQNKNNKRSNIFLAHGLVTDKNVFRNELFDVITMIEVAEHLLNLEVVMRSCFEKLNRGGLLLIQTANFSAWQAKTLGKHYNYFMPGHLNYFTSKGLKILLRNVGFSKFKEYHPVDFSLWAKIKKMKASGVSIFIIVKSSIYHLKSFFKYKDRPLTSSFVIYAFKK